MYGETHYKTSPVRENLPQQQLKVLDFVEEFIDISGYPPSVAEITEFLGVASTFGVRKHLDALIRKGFLIRAGEGLARSLVIARPTMMHSGMRRASSMPIVGRVTAGAPILAVENIEGWLAFKPIKDPQKMFAL